MGERESSVKDELEKLHSVLDPLMQGKKGLKVLEAGCGSRSLIQLPPDACIVGVDISEDQLSKNTGLHEKRVGDIQTCDLGEDDFDLIICWDVLEHLDRPLDAVSNFFRAVKKDGAIILAFPNVMSVKGLVTKFTPHLFHIMAYRYLWQQKTIGKKGYYAPFRTYMRFGISPDALRTFAGKHGFETAHCRAYQGVMQRQLRRRNVGIDRLFQAAEPLVKALTLGSVGVKDSDVIVVLKKGEDAPSEP
jgi:2-polyprenyl-3-methyl-5-hydroxy-6-metoxy-1,4-benzoquinol methylase